MVRPRKWKTLDSQWALDRRWCRVRQDKVELPNGHIIDEYFVNVKPEIAVVLPLTPAQEVILVRQYRHGVGENVWELPAGILQSLAESSQAAAERELAEETGYRARTLTKLAALYNNPSKDTNCIHVFLAEGAIPVESPQPDITEEIEVGVVPLQAVRERIRAGELCAAVTLAALFVGLDWLGQRDAA